MHQQASLIAPDPSSVRLDTGSHHIPAAAGAVSHCPIRHNTRDRLSGCGAVSADPNLEEVFQCLPSGLVVLNSKGIVQRCNEAAERLLDSSLVGKSWREIIAGVFRPRPDDGHELSLRNGRRVQVLTHPLFESPGQLILINDVTETRELQQQLSRQQRLANLGQMMASLAHQVRTPLSAALLYARQLQSARVEGATRERFASKVVARLQDLEQLILELLLFARGSAFGQEPIHLADLFREVTELLEPQLAETGTRLQVNIEGDIVLPGNRQGLKTALQNLLTNAMDVADGKVTVSLQGRLLDNDRVAITVADDGPGIDAAVREQLFEPFVTTRSNGTGLGLAVVRTIVEAHRGEICVERRQSGGSLFRIWLPVKTTLSPTSNALHRLDAGPGSAREELR